VTLTIESGPGEFPTGPSITFAPDSDITIRDGMAAMTFRSYHAGTTLIRATSPGLKGLTIRINSLGEPKHVVGVTPPVQARPHVRFTGDNQTAAVITTGRNNPTRTSSEAPAHSGRMANDGNPATFWKAAENDRNAWLRIDLEKVLTVNRTRILFPAEGNWRYKIEVSEDGESDWKLVADQSQTGNTFRGRTDIVTADAPRGRFLCVTVVGGPAGQAGGVAEVEVAGTSGTLAAK
jgi:hypothetical protein